MNRMCAFCGSKVNVYRKKTSSLLNIFLSGLTALFCHLIFWDQFDARVFLFWVVFLMLGEIFVQIRWRLSIVCRTCGFDPVIYLKNSREAVEKVKIQLERRRTLPQYALAPPLRLPKISKARLTEIESKIVKIDLKKTKSRLALRI